ncbi:hypothetical protein NIES4075_65490 [Tolypothrix sp. NIES-4075]|nr:hypothetical protein NIES4075_65490 [Tolypothrix sp. NIES-4075]
MDGFNTFGFQGLDKIMHLFVRGLYLPDAKAIPSVGVIGQGKYRPGFAGIYLSAGS